MFRRAGELCPAVPWHVAGGDVAGPHSIQAPPCPGQGTQLPCCPGGHAAQRGCGHLGKAPFPPQPHSSREPVPPGRGVLQALAPEPHPRRLPPSRGVRPKELGTGPRLWLPPRTHHRVIMASEGALGRRFPSLSSPEDDRHGPPITGFLAGPAHLAGEQLMRTSIWA